MAPLSQINDLQRAHERKIDLCRPSLTNESTGLKAVVSRNSLDKMLSGKAVAKSETPATHAMAVANADSLFEHAILGWSKQDRSDDVNIRAVHRFFAHMQVNGRSKLVKLTVKEMASLGFSNPLYTIEAVELNERVPSAQWLEAAVREDGLELNTKDPQRGEWVVEIANSQELALKQTLYGAQFPARAVNHSAEDVLSLAQEIERRNARGDAAGDATPRFSTRSNDQGPGLSLEQVQQLVQQALSGLRNPPPVDVVLRATDLGIVAPEGAMGVWTGNRLAIVVENHRQVIQVRETVFHELFHAGLRNILPRRDYVQAMLDLAKRDARVHQYAMDWKKDAPEAAMQLQALRDAGFAGSELTAQYEALAIEEGLAVVAEELRGRMQAGLRLGEQVRVLAGWLASVADRMGMNRLADAIRAMTYSEAERFVIRAIDHAGAVGGEMENSGRARFSTRRAQAPQDGAATFFAQPTDSVQMQIQRDGTLMVRGDPTQLQERLRQGGVDRVLRRKGGVLVGLDQVHKARQLLQQPSPRAQASAGATLPSQSSLPDQQFSRSAPPSPDRPSRARGLPSKPATVQSVRAAVAKLTNSMGLLAEGRGRVVVAASEDIKAHWEPLIGEVDMGSQDIGLAQGFFDPSTDTVFLIADHIEAGQEMAVAAHELAHKHGKAVLGEAGWRHLHEVIGSWANRPEGSLERRVYDEAMARVQASRPDSAAPDTYSSEELFPYAVQVAMELGVQPTALMPANSVQGWLARVRAAMRGAWDRLTNKPELFDSQDLVDLAFAVAQRENPAYASEFDEPSASVSPGPGITGQQMQGLVDKALDGLGMRGMVAPQIAQSPGVVGLVAPPGTVATGGVYRGELYLFLEGIRDEVEGFRVVFHELFHLGLSQSIQPEEYRQAMLQFLSDPLVRKYAARWRMTEDGQSSKAKMPVNNWHAKAVEEAMADISEELHADQRGMGTREMADWVRRTIAWIEPTWRTNGACPG